MELLRAWDAADEYILNHLHEQAVLTPDTSKRTLIVNDSFGALSCALHSFAPDNWSDSSIAHMAAKENLKANEFSTDLNTIESLQDLEGHYDVVIIKIPKTTSFLEEQLIRLKPHVTKDTVIIAAGMVKHLQKSAFQCFERIMGPVTTSLAKKKARLLFAEVDESLAEQVSPYPTTYIEPDVGVPLSNHANLFSREHLDLGARFFLTQYTEMPKNAKHVIDLASGNGVLGIKYQQMSPDAQISFLDESYMAVASSKENYEATFPDIEAAASFLATDGLRGIESQSVDLILCNPPFHQQHVVGEQIAMDMFLESKRCLAQGGSLWVVANVHLAYQAKLTQMFGNCRTVDSDKRFAVMKVIKR
ncbi:50S rRNA methyltransferase [Leucothrix arctica]|uniref:50S rRNA methyltransferase n=2 Tax=Leucothrix arctica TaxID=1481894 RepID=A0A317C5U6_9GAMM|nr:50S rRNA methyltransferase [Leucothrix arctica]